MPRTAPVASIVLNQPNPKYGDRVTFDVVANVNPTTVNLTIFQAGVPIAYGGTLIYSALSYTADEFGLYAPSWPSGAAHCVAEVKLVTTKSSSHWKVIGSTEFEVAA